MWGRERRKLRRDIKEHERISAATHGRPIRWERSGNVFRGQVCGVLYEFALIGHDRSAERTPLVSHRSSDIEDVPASDRSYFGSRVLMLYSAVLVDEDGAERTFDSLNECLTEDAVV